MYYNPISSAHLHSLGSKRVRRQARIYHYHVLQAHPKLSTKRLTLAPPFMIDAGPAAPMRKVERTERVIESEPQTVSIIMSAFDAGYRSK